MISDGMDLSGLRYRFLIGRFLTLLLLMIPLLIRFLLFRLKLRLLSVPRLYQTISYSRVIHVDRLLSITVWCSRFLRECCKELDVPSLSTPPTAFKLDQTLTLCIRIVQSDVFATDIARLKSGRLCSKKLSYSISTVHGQTRTLFSCL